MKGWLNFFRPDVNAFTGCGALPRLLSPQMKAAAFTRHRTTMIPPLISLRVPKSLKPLPRSRDQCKLALVALISELPTALDCKVRNQEEMRCNRHLALIAGLMERREYVVDEPTWGLWSPRFRHLDH
jgi:hypothetical protein